MPKTKHKTAFSINRENRQTALISIMLCLLILKLTLFPYGYDHKKSALAYIVIDGKGRNYSIGQAICGKVIADIQKDKVIFDDKTEIVKTN